MLNLESLKELVTFADCGTLSKAAEILHTSQPSLSRSMKKLEDELQADLFTHGKNRLELNDTGKYAVTLARRVIDESDFMERAVQLYDRQLNTISIGSVAPAPLWNLPAYCSRAFPDKTLNTELTDETTLLQGLLAKDTYQIIILPYALDDPRCKSFFFESENLMLCVPKKHRLARRKSVKFEDFDGESMLVFSQIGFWDRIHRTNLPKSRFIMQEDQSDLLELSKNSDLPTFVTDLSLASHGLYGKGRVAIPISDPDAHVDFYCVYPKEKERLLKPLLRLLKNQESNPVSQ